MLFVYVRLQLVQGKKSYLLLSTASGLPIWDSFIPEQCQVLQIVDYKKNTSMSKNWWLNSEYFYLNWELLFMKMNIVYYNIGQTFIKYISL